VLEVQSSRGGMPIEIRERITAIQAESDNDDPVRTNMISDSGQDFGLGIRSDERHNVAGENRGIERCWLPHSHEVEFGKVSNQPHRSGMICLGCGDQLGVDIDANDRVPAGRELSSDPSWTTPRIEDARSPPDDGVEQPRLAGQVNTVSSHPAETIDVPAGMARFVIGNPARQCTHSPNPTAIRPARPRQLSDENCEEVQAPEPLCARSSRARDPQMNP
jgi:hypothetical protein